MRRYHRPRGQLENLVMNILVITNTVLTSFLTLVMALFYFSHRTYSGFRQWTIGGCLNACSFLMVLLRGLVPTSLAIRIQNFLFPRAAVLYLNGTRGFLGLSDMSRIWYALPAISGLFSVFSVLFFDSAPWRTCIRAVQHFLWVFSAHP